MYIERNYFVGGLLYFQERIKYDTPQQLKEFEKLSKAMPIKMELLSLSQQN